MTYLKIVLRVPVTVKDDNGVGCSQVDTETARPRGEKEAKVLRPGGVEVIDCVLAQLALDAAIQPLERKPAQL